MTQESQNQSKTREPLTPVKDELNLISSLVPVLGITPKKIMIDVVERT